MNTYQMALKLAKREIYYYPTITNGKGGLKGSHGLRDAVNDDSKAREWFLGTNLNIAINLKKSGLIVLDIDRNHANGVDGKHSLAKVIKEYGDIPNDTLIEKSPNGGLHFFFKLPNRIRVKNIIGAFYKDSAIDLITTNVLISPSSINGVSYTHVCGSYDDIKPIPSWLLEYISKRSNSVRSGNINTGAYKKYTGVLIDKIVTGASSGNRNDFITSIAGSMLAVGADANNVYELLLVINQHFVTPSLSTKELDTIYYSIVTRELERLKGVRWLDELKNKIKELSQTQNDKDKVIDLWKEQFLKTDKGTPRSNSSKNVYLILQNDARLKNLIQYNEFSEQLVKRVANESLNTLPGDWQDSDDSKLKLFIEDNYGYVSTRDAIGDAIIKFGMDHTFNPVKERIESVTWDGAPRVETFFIDYLGTEDSEYVREITKRWLVGAVARVYKPGIKFEMVPILFGGQGLGKSTLVGSIYRDYFLDELNSMGKNKDDFQQLKGKWLIEIGELSAMRKTDVEHVKAFISAQSDNYRPSFGHYATDHPRKSVFIGTSNPPEFLKDPSGNRRFFPIEINVQDKKKDPFHIDDNDIKQVLAEAKVMFDDDVKPFVDSELQKVAEKYQKDSMIQNPTEEQIISYLDMLVPTNWNDYNVFQRQQYFTRFNENEGYIDKSGTRLSSDELVSIDQVTTNDILQGAFNISNDQLLSASRGNVGKQISDVMNGQDNWKRDNHVKVNGNNKRGYKRK